MKEYSVTTRLKDLIQTDKSPITNRYIGIRIPLVLGFGFSATRRTARTVRLPLKYASVLPAVVTVTAYAEFENVI